MMELNKIFNEDCRETMKRMPDNFIDLTVTSPPYDNLRNYNGYDFDFEPIDRELFRVTKKGGVVVWVVGDATINGSESGTSFRQALYFKECGFNLHDTMIYKKENAIPLTHNRYEQCYEYMFCFSKGIPKTFNPILVRTINFNKKNDYSKKRKVKEQSFRERKEAAPVKETKIRENIFIYSVGYSPDKHEHPAAFPEPLAADQIKSWSNESDLVYEPFTGSGTTLKMAHLLKRNWIGSEISAEYCRIAEKRIAPYLAQKTLF